MVANFLELKPTKEFGLCSARGLTNYPNGHAFAHEVVRMRRNDILMGRAPIDDKSVYWFTALQLTGEGKSFIQYVIFYLLNESSVYCLILNEKDYCPL